VLVVGLTLIGAIFLWQQGTPRDARALSTKRIPLVTLRDWAIEAGWNGDVQAVAGGNNDFWTFKNRLRQAAVDGKIAFWGRKYEYLPKDLIASEPLVSIPADHFAEFNFDAVELANADNDEIFTGKTSIPRTYLKHSIYRDLHVASDQARSWLNAEGRPPTPCSITIKVNTAAAKIGDYTPIAGVLATNTTKKDLDKCLVQLEQLSGLHPEGMPLPLILRTDGQIRGSRKGRFLLSPSQPETVPILFNASPRKNEWFFIDENGKRYFVPARSLKAVLGVYGGPASGKMLLDVILQQGAGWSPCVSLESISDNYVLPEGP